MSSAPDAVLDVPHFVYRCFDEAGALLYIGVARDVEARMFHHLHLCNIGKQPNGALRRYMASHTSERYDTKLAARTAERQAIHDEAPLLNRQHNPKRFRKNARGSYDALEPVHAITSWAFEPDARAS